MTFPRQRERCSQCGQAIPKPSADAAKAERLWISLGGRNLYAVEGHPGLWALTIDEDADSVDVRSDSGHLCKMYRSLEAERRIAAAMGGVLFRGTPKHVIENMRCRLRKML